MNKLILNAINLASSKSQAAAKPRSLDSNWEILSLESCLAVKIYDVQRQQV